jgi:hypothetical protein
MSELVGSASEQLNFLGLPEMSLKVEVPKTSPVGHSVQL